MAQRTSSKDKPVEQGRRDFVKGGLVATAVTATVSIFGNFVQWLDNTSLRLQLADKDTEIKKLKEEKNCQESQMTVPKYFRSTELEPLLGELTEKLMEQHEIWTHLRSCHVLPQGCPTGEYITQKNLYLQEAQFYSSYIPSIWAGILETENLIAKVHDKIDAYTKRVDAFSKGLVGEDEVLTTIKPPEFELDGVSYYSVYGRLNEAKDTADAKKLLDALNAIADRMKARQKLIRQGFQGLNEGSKLFLDNQQRSSIDGFIPGGLEMYGAFWLLDSVDHQQESYELCPGLFEGGRTDLEVVFNDKLPESVRAIIAPRHAEIIMSVAQDSGNPDKFYGMLKDLDPDLLPQFHFAFDFINDKTKTMPEYASAVANALKYGFQYSWLNTPLALLHVIQPKVNVEHDYQTDFRYPDKLYDLFPTPLALSDEQLAAGIMYNILSAVDKGSLKYEDVTKTAKLECATRRILDIYAGTPMEAWGVSLIEQDDLEIAGVDTDDMIIFYGRGQTGNDRAYRIRAELKARGIVYGKDIPGGVDALTYFNSLEDKPYGWQKMQAVMGGSLATDSSFSKYELPTS